jgi:hypothetical protein
MSCCIGIALFGDNNNNRQTSSKNDAYIKIEVSCFLFLKNLIQSDFFISRIFFLLKKIKKGVLITY